MFADEQSFATIGHPIERLFMAGSPGRSFTVTPHEENTDMVASRHPSSRSAGARSLDHPVGPRPASRRSNQGSVRFDCRDQRPRLRLVVDNTAVDNTACGPRGTSGVTAAVEPGSIPAELGAWLRSWAGLADARWRLARQRWIIRHPSLMPAGRIAGLGPVVGVAAVVVFGALFGVRLVQESSSGLLDGPAGSVAAVATSTSSAGASSDSDGTARPGSTIVVHPGDSLWSIAVSRYPEHDPRAVVDALVEANGASMIRAGQQLVVPAALLQD